MKKLSTLVVILLLSIPVYADVTVPCSGRLGKYVNITMTSAMIGRGVSDAFPVQAVRYDVLSDTELLQIQSFPVFKNQSDYLWIRKGNRYILYQTVPGKPRTALELYILRFEPGREIDSLMRLQQADSTLFSRYNLLNRLRFLGIMGVERQNGKQKVAFVSGLQIEPLNGGSREVIISNADAMLMRFAAEQYMDGVEKAELPASISDAKGFRTTMGIQNIGVPREQMLLDTYFKDNAILDAIYTKAGDESISGEMKVRYVYKDCTPKGDSLYGSPKAAFVPAANDDGSYSLFVFPGAFESYNTLLFSIKRELYHAQWWNMMANMPADSEVREYFMRILPARLELDIVSRSTKLTIDSKDADEAALIFYQINMLKTHLLNIIEDPNQHTKKMRLPWTLDSYLIVPHTAAAESTDTKAPAASAVSENLFGIPDSLYAQALTKEVIEYDGEVHWYEYMLLRTKSGQAAKKTQNIAEMEKAFLNAIIRGYSVPKEVRTARWQGNLLAFDSYLQMKYGLAGAELTSSADTILKKAYAKGYARHDLEWMAEMMKENKPFRYLKDIPSGQFVETLGDTIAALGTEDDRYYSWLSYATSEYPLPVQAYFTNLPASCYITHQIEPLPGESFGITLKRLNQESESCTGVSLSHSPAGIFQNVQAAGITALRIADLVQSMEQDYTAITDAISDCPADTAGCSALKDGRNELKKENSIGSVKKDIGGAVKGLSDSTDGYMKDMQSAYADAFRTTVASVGDGFFSRSGGKISSTFGGSPTGNYTQMQKSLTIMNLFWADYGVDAEIFDRTEASALEFLERHLQDWRRLERGLEALKTERAKMLTTGRDAAALNKEIILYESFMQSYRAAATEAKILDMYRALIIGIAESDLLIKSVKSFTAVKKRFEQFADPFLALITKTGRISFASAPSSEIQRMRQRLTQAKELLKEVDAKLVNDIANVAHSDAGERLFLDLKALAGGITDSTTLTAFIAGVHQQYGIIASEKRKAAQELAEAIVQKKDAGVDQFITLSHQIQSR